MSIYDTFTVCNVCDEATGLSLEAVFVRWLSSRRVIRALVFSRCLRGWRCFICLMKWTLHCACVVVSSPSFRPNVQSPPVAHKCDRCQTQIKFATFKVWSPRDMNDFSCAFLTFMNYTWGDMAIWMVVAVDLERFVAVWWPLQVSSYCCRVAPHSSPASSSASPSPKCAIDCL